ncbi:MAG TPA: DUF952 domain-containing protein [Devosia sp.]|nr:DUF952 domain-containing protein [Devosia sp.]
MTPDVPEFVYKIVSRAAFEAASNAGQFPVMPIDLKDGFVHFSTAAQLAETLRLHFAGQSDLMVFAVAAASLGPRLRWEPSRGGQLFPHGYGILPAALVGRHAAVSVGADGSVSLPDFVR